MKFALIDNRMCDVQVRALERYAENILHLPPHPLLPFPVASHPDMLMWIYGHEVVTYADYIPVAKEVFLRLECAGYSIVPYQKSPSPQYPFDIALNCATVGCKIISNQKYMSESIKEIALNRGLQILNVKQGYAKCSTVIVSDTAIITADSSIEKTALKAGIDVLKVSPCQVELDGYNTGFLGGASGTTTDAVIFCGNIALHSDAEQIKSFCAKHGKQVVSLSEEPLYDYGTIMFLD